MKVRLFSKRYLFFYFSISLIAILIVSNFYTLKLLNASFIKIQKNRIYPNGPEVNVITDTKPIYLIGDSRLQLWPSRLKFRDKQIVNLAVGGHTSAQVLNRLRTVNMRRDSISIVQLGINDIHSLKIFYNENKVVEDLKKNIDRILQHIPSDNIYILTIFPPAKVPFQRVLYWSTETIDYIDALNLYIKNKSSKRIHIVDTHKILSKENKLIKEKYEDPSFFLHINYLGYQKIHEELSKFIF